MEQHLAGAILTGLTLGRNSFDLFNTLTLIEV